MTKRAVSGETLHNLFREVYHLQRRLAPVADELHEQSGLGSPQRQILAFLHEHGSESVPHMARLFGVSRQHVQANVNALVEKALVRLIPNPHHKKSSLVEMTAEGKAALDDAREREEALMAPLAAFLNEHDVLLATNVLRQITAHLGNGTRQGHA